jgi:hypothetical protein
MHREFSGLVARLRLALMFPACYCLAAAFSDRTMQCPKSEQLPKVVATPRTMRMHVTPTVALAMDRHGMQQQPCSALSARGHLMLRCASA